MVAPTRVVIEGKTRSSELVLLNRGTSTVTYRISVVEMRMMPDGRIERVPSSDTSARSAKRIIRFAPHQVTLAPGESQRIRVGIMKPPDLAVGEYRSHLLFEALPPATNRPLIDVPTSLSLRFTVVGAVTLPVIVRHGQMSASATLSPPELRDGEVVVHLKRSGERSIRGDMNVYFQAEGSKKRIAVGLFREVAVYADNAERIVRIRLTNLDAKLSGGKLFVTFEEPSGVPGARVRAQSEAVLPH